jgi:hypothetical protein
VSRSHIVVPTLAVLAVVGIAGAQTTGSTVPADPERLKEQYVIPPGSEPLFSDMLGGGSTLPGECTLGNGAIERTRVVATYKCGGGEVMLQLVHPETARADAVRTQRFAVVVASGAPPAGLVGAVADRVRARESAFEWTAAPDFGKVTQGSDDGDTQTRWHLAVAAAVAAVAIVLLWALRRLPARRRRPG